MKRYLWILLCMLTSWVTAAPVATPSDSIDNLTKESSYNPSVQFAVPQKPIHDAYKSKVFMNSEEFLQHPDLLKNALDTAILRENTSVVRFLLPLYDRLPENQRDKTLGEYAHAIVASADGQYAQAEQQLRALLVQNTEYAPVRLQLARVLAKDGQLRDAAKEIDTLKQTPDMPNETTQYLEQFDHYLVKEQAWKFNANTYYIQDDNVGRVPQQRQYGYWRFSEPKSAHGVGYDLSAQKNMSLKGHWATRVNVSTSGKFYWDAHDYDDLQTHAEVGTIWRNAKREISVSPFYEKRWYGGKPYSHNAGGVLRYSEILSPKWQVWGAWQSAYKKHDKRQFLDGANHAGSVTLVYAPDPKQYFVMGGGSGYQAAKDKSEAYSQTNARVGWHRQWKNTFDLTTDFNFLVQSRHYQAPDFFNIKRRDKEYMTRVSVSSPKFSWKGFEPRLNWTWSRINSNHFYYRYKNHHVFIDVSKQFK